MKNRAFSRGLVVPLLIVVYLLAPLYLGDYLTYLLLITSIMVIVAQGLNVLIGFTGLISFGQPGFMAFSAYFSTILVKALPWMPFPIMLILSASVTAVLGLIIGFPCLRLSGIYLALATFGFTSAMYQLINYFKAFTGGYVGISVPAPAVAGWKLTGTDNVYYLVALCTVIVILVVSNLSKTRTGRAWNAVRDDEIAASSMGVNLRREKLKAFAFSAFLAGVAGVLYSYAIRYLETNYFDLMGLSLFLILVIGGIGRVYGPVLGAAFITALPQLLGGIFNQQMSLIYGIVLVGFILLAPQGFYGMWQRIRGISVSGYDIRSALFRRDRRNNQETQDE